MISAEVFAYAVVPGTVVVLTLVGYGIALRATSPQRLDAAKALSPNRTPPPPTSSSDVLPMRRRAENAGERPFKSSVSDKFYIESQRSTDLEELLALRLETLNSAIARDDHPGLTMERTICARQIEDLLTSLSKLRGLAEQAVNGIGGP